ncbi:MAG: alpha/beta hydrolase family protein [Armatimonadota bacterium]
MQRILGIFLVSLIGIGAAWAQDAGARLVGTWAGTLKVQNQQLRLVFKITAGANGTLTGTLDSPDQGATDIPVPKVVLDGNKVQLQMPMLRAQFTGTLNGKGDTITGQFSQGGANLPLVLTRTVAAPGLNRPQQPKPPFPYQDEPVAFTNPRAGIRLAGTLTYPDGRGPFPAVVLIAGSGPSDRDETLFGHKPFWVLADYLTRRGIAVLRYDKRGIGASTGNLATATMEDYADDALAGVEYLKARKDVADPARIGLIGHSEGGTVAPMVANRTPDVSFLVLLAGDGVVGEQILLLQGAAIVKAMGGDDAAIAEQNAVQRALFAILKQHPNDETARQKLHQYFTDRINALPEEQRQAMGDPEPYIQGQIAFLVNPWMRHFLTYDPATALRKLRVPVLALNGSKDTQVTPAENLAAITAVLKESGTKDVTVRELPDLNHLFQTADTGSPQEYGQIEETFSPEALQIIGDWVVQRTKKK